MLQADRKAFLHYGLAGMAPVWDLFGHMCRSRQLAGITWECPVGSESPQMPEWGSCILFIYFIPRNSRLAL